MFDGGLIDIFLWLPPKYGYQISKPKVEIVPITKDIIKSDP